MLLHQEFNTLFYETLQPNEKIIVHGGHFAFGYFIEEYQVTFVSPYANISPDGEPIFSNIIEVIEVMETNNLQYLFIEELVEPRVADTISDEFSAKGIEIQILLLHGLHNVSKAELDNGETYVSLMRNNLINLKKGLGVE